MEKKKKNYWLLVIGLVIGLLIGGLVVYKVLESSNKNDNKDNSNHVNDRANEEKNMSNEQIYKELSAKQGTISEEKFMDNLEKDNNEDTIVKNDIKRLLFYMNAESEDFEGTACKYLNYYFDYDSFINGKDVLKKLSPHIMECMYGIDYNYVEDNSYGGSKIMSQNQYQELKDYFINYPVLKQYDEEWNDNRSDDDKNDYYDNAKDFLGKDYLYAYGCGDGFGMSGVFLRENGISKKNNIYEINIEAYTNSSMRSSENEGIEKYTGVLQVEVVNGHLKYHELQLTKNK